MKTKIRFQASIISPKKNDLDSEENVGTYSSFISGILHYLNNGLGFKFTKQKLYSLKSGEEYLIEGNALNSAVTDWKWRGHISERRELELPFHVRIEKEKVRWDADKGMYIKTN